MIFHENLQFYRRCSIAFLQICHFHVAGTSPWQAERLRDTCRLIDADGDGKAGNMASWEISYKTGGLPSGKLT